MLSQLPSLLSRYIQSANRSLPVNNESRAAMLANKMRPHIVSQARLIKKVKPGMEAENQCE